MSNDSIHSTSDSRDSDSEAERHGYNIAFGELGLQWFWDANTYRELAAIREPKRRIGVYVEAHHPHLLRAYPLDFLANAVENMRPRSGSVVAH